MSSHQRSFILSFEMLFKFLMLVYIQQQQFFQFFEKMDTGNPNLANWLSQIAIKLQITIDVRHTNVNQPLKLCESCNLYDKVPFKQRNL